MKLHLPKPLFTAVIAAMALSPTAWGETYDLLASQGGWTLTGRNHIPVYHADNNTITTYHWCQAVVTNDNYIYMLESNEDDHTESLSFSFTLQSLSPSNSILGIALSGSGGTVALGTLAYDTSSISYGVTENNTGDFYVTSTEAWQSGKYNPYTLTSITDIGTRTNEAYTIEGTVTKKDDDNYYLSLKLNGAEVTPDAVNLGSTFDISRIILQSDGGNQTTSTLSNLTITGKRIYSGYIATISGNVAANDTTWYKMDNEINYADITMTDGTAVLGLTGSGEGATVTFENGTNVKEINILEGNVTLKASGTLTTEKLNAIGSNATIGSNMSIGSVYGAISIADKVTMSLNSTNLDFIVSATGTGTILLNEGANITSNTTSNFSGSIAVAANKTLTFGDDQNDKLTFSNATIQLSSGSKLSVAGQGSTLGTLIAKENSELYFWDGDTNNKLLTVEELKIDSGKTLKVTNSWEGIVTIEKLNAEGHLNLQTSGDSSSNYDKNLSVIIESIEKSGKIDSVNKLTLGVAGENSILNIGGTITNSGTLILADGNVTLNVSDISIFQGAIEYDTDKLWDVATQKASKTGNGFATKAGYMQVLSNTGTVQIGADAITDFSTIKVTYNGQDATMTEAGKVYGASNAMTGTYVIGGEGDNATVAWSTIQTAAQTAGIEVEQIQLKDNTTLEVDANANLSAELLNAADTAKVNVGESVTVTASGTGGLYNANYIKNMTGTGTLLVNHNTLIGGTDAPLSSEFAGTISVTDGTLHLGATGEAVPVANEINLSKLASIEVTGGKLRYTGGSSTVSKVDIQESSELYIFGTNAGNSYQGTLTLETLNVDNSKKFTIKGHWDFNLSIDKLTGTGAIELSKPENIYDYQANYNIKAVEDGAAISNASVLNLGTSSSSILNMGDVTNSGTLNIKGQLTGTSTISGGTIKLADDVTVKGTVTMATAFAQEAGKTLTVDGGKLTAETATTLNKLVVENSGKATLNGADSTTNINELTIKGSDGLDGSANVKVNNALTIDSQNAFALTGALDLTGATVDLSGFTLDTTLTEQSYSYTLGTAMGGITITETTQLNLAAVDGYTATLAALAADPSTSSVMLLDGAATNNYLVLTLTKVEEPVTTLTAMEVTGHAGYNADTNVLTLMTDKDATNATFGDTLAITMADETWNQILAELAELGTTLPEEIRLSFMGTDNNIFDFDGGEDNVITPPTTITINGEPGVGENGATVQGDGTVVGSYKTAYIPEPTTSTLSLLALAALAVRRRRR